MNPPSMETIFLLLSGVILFAGVIYWLWSHIQLIQKKVQLLENAVFELRAMIPGGGTAGPPVSVASVQPTPASTPISSPPLMKAPSAYTDLADDDWSEDVSSDADIKAVPTVSTPLDAFTPSQPTPLPELITRETEIPDDLMPGGRIQIEKNEQTPQHSSVIDDTASVVSSMTAEEKFKKILSGRVAGGSSDTQALEGMPLKELRRLGEQRGIHGAMEMRKKELLATLRSMVATKKEETEEHQSGSGTLDLSTVDESTLLGDVVEPAPETSESVDL